MAEYFEPLRHLSRFLGVGALLAKTRRRKQVKELSW